MTVKQVRRAAEMSGDTIDRDGFERLLPHHRSRRLRTAARAAGGSGSEQRSAAADAFPELMQPGADAQDQKRAARKAPDHSANGSCGRVLTRSIGALAALRAIIDCEGLDVKKMCALEPPSV
jgi:hypothetical protein